MEFLAMVCLVLVFVCIVLASSRASDRYSWEREQKLLQDRIAALQEQIAFFTEISEDSKQINESVDREQQERLFAQIAEELWDGKADSSVLDAEQKAALKLMLDTNRNLFITGKAGTGKSFLVEVFKRVTAKKVLLLAPTGVAALHIGGATLHSAFGYKNLVDIPLEELTLYSLQLTTEKKTVLQEANTLIIDEISMVRADIFEKIDYILRLICRKDVPFGGKQMILLGDLFQLPPVANKTEIQYLNDAFGGVYFFHAPAYQEASFEFVELTINHRQKDDRAFFDILNRIRDGKADAQDMALLNTRTQFEQGDLRRVIQLFPTKAEAERVNTEELRKIPAKPYVYFARTKKNDPRIGKINIESAFPILECLELKKGALVMMVANDNQNNFWVNGTLGIVSDLNEEYVRVSIDGDDYLVTPALFEYKEAVYEDNKIQYRTQWETTQYPLVPAYAITIHKSQGMTYPRVACDIRKCFAPGQAYVALSRCTTLDGLFLLSPVNENLMLVDETVRAFYLSQTQKDPPTEDDLPF